MKNVAVFSAVYLLVAIGATNSLAPSFAQGQADCTPVECYRLALEKLQAAEDRAAAAEKAMTDKVAAYQEETVNKMTAQKEATLQQIRNEFAPPFQAHNVDLKSLNEKVKKISAGGGANLVDGNAVNVVGGKTEAWCKQGNYLAGLKFYWSGTCKSQCNADGAILSKIEAVCRPLSG